MRLPSRRWGTSVPASGPREPLRRRFDRLGLGIEPRSAPRVTASWFRNAAAEHLRRGSAPDTKLQSLGSHAAVSGGVEAHSLRLLDVADLHWTRSLSALGVHARRVFLRCAAIRRVRPRPLVVHRSRSGLLWAARRLRKDSHHASGRNGGTVDHRTSASGNLDASPFFADTASVALHGGACPSALAGIAAPLRASTLAGQVRYTVRRNTPGHGHNACRCSRDAGSGCTRIPGHRPSFLCCIAVLIAAGRSERGARLRGNARAGGSEPARGLYDLEAMQRFASGPGPFALFDAPWMPVFLFVLFTFHWLRGLLAVFSGALLLALALLNQARTARLQSEAGMPRPRRGIPSRARR